MLCMLMTSMTEKPSQNIILIIFCLVLKNGFAKSSPIVYFEKLKLFKKVATQTNVWFKNPFHYKIIKCQDILSQFLPKIRVIPQFKCNLQVFKNVRLFWDTLYDIVQIHHMMDPVHHMMYPVHHMMDRGVHHMMDRVHHMMDGVHHMMDTFFRQICYITGF